MQILGLPRVKCALSHIRGAACFKLPREEEKPWKRTKCEALCTAGNDGCQWDSQRHLFGGVSPVFCACRLRRTPCRRC